MSEVSAKVRGYIVCYDLYASYDPEKGYGKHPSRARRVLKKLLGGDDVERLQGSVLLVKNPVALSMVLDALRPFAKSILVVRGEGEVYYLEPQKK